MKIVFSEYHSDYNNYIFPYAIWGFPEGNEPASTLFENGFLPASRDLDRFYLCRQVRVKLMQFQASSENRRILRKGEGISYNVLTRNQFDYTAERRNAYKNYADIKFGKDVMTTKRLDSLFESNIITHIIVFTDTESGKEVGTVTLFLDANQLAFYYYSFYDLNYYARNLGMFMMTSAVKHFADNNFKYIYLGTCYTKNALYKTQFKGAEFFTGFGWSNNFQELKFLIKRDHPGVEKHLLENPEFCEKYYENNLSALVENSPFRV